MDEAKLLLAIRLGLLKDLARQLQMGTATHQEKAIAKGLLRDNKMALDPKKIANEEEPHDDEDEPDTPVQPRRVPRVFPDSKG